MAEADMTASTALIEHHRLNGQRVTYTHLFIKAVALTLADHPAIHQLVASSQRLRPASVDVSISIAGDTALSPLRGLLSQVRFRRESTGTFQITCIPTVELMVPFLFSTSAILAAGQVKERAIVVDSQLVVRRTVKLACSIDHKVWNGADANTFLRALTQRLEASNLQPGVPSTETLIRAVGA